MNIQFHRLAATSALAIAAVPFFVASSLAAPVASAAEKSDATLVAAVRDALSNSLGKEAGDLAVTARQGKVILHGWVKLPRQEAEARAVASKVPGIKATLNKPAHSAIQYGRCH